ncbi:MAG: hypothetical protein HY063_14980 [Bacteroidetes bacterium]|nr:hypothetical protein [Bacteroidota bacterium]
MITPIRFSFCLLLTAYCLLAFFISCKQKTDYSKEISRIDSANNILAETEKVLESADTNSFRANYNSSFLQLHSIYEKLAKDTINKKTAMFLSDASECSGNILNLLDNKKYLERAIKESEHRISDLKHDLKEDLIEKNKSQEYIVNEMNAAGKISNVIQRTIEKAKIASAKLDSMKTQITFLADSLNLRPR